jgi:hypothetical protein
MLADDHAGVSGVQTLLLLLLETKGLSPAADSKCPALMWRERRVPTGEVASGSGSPEVKHAKVECVKGWG